MFKVSNRRIPFPTPNARPVIRRFDLATLKVDLAALTIDLPDLNAESRDPGVESQGADVRPPWP
jgi:hypothetical protein